MINTIFLLPQPAHVIILEILNMENILKQKEAHLQATLERIWQQNNGKAIS